MERLKHLQAIILDNQEKANQLALANQQLAFQDAEKEKRAAELAVANKELVFQNLEKEKRAAELAVANKELVFQNKEKEKRVTELGIINEELLVQKEEKEIQAEELRVVNRKLKSADIYLEKYIKGMKEMMFMISHHVRQPVVNILGLSNLIDTSRDPGELKTMLGFIKRSAKALDVFTKELVAFMRELGTTKKS
jgi:signal transduction histidine kinase